MNDTPFQIRAAPLAFGRFLLDPTRRVLLADGEPVNLQPRAFDILAFLIASRDRIVTREEIICHVWQGQIVADNNLTVQLSLLRRTLAQHGGDKTIITLPNRGYRFVAEMQPHFMPPGAGLAEPAPAMLTPAPAAPGRTGVPIQAAPKGLRPLLPAALAAVLALAAVWVGWTVLAPRPAPPLSIAVLPFKNFSADKNLDYMAEAITDDLTTDLAHIPGSFVIARESTDGFAGHPVPSAQIGRALNVRYLLEGSLQPEEGGFHINAQLFDARTGAHLWAQKFPTRLTGIAQTRDTIVRRIASALDVRLTDIESSRVAHERPDDPDSQALFFRARSIVNHADTAEALTTAQRLLEQAVAQTPNFADALAELGIILIQKIHSTDDPSDAQDRLEARNMLARALALAPRNATALAADAMLHKIEGNCTAAAFSARAALAEEPNNIDALVVLANCALNDGQIDEAASNETEILRLNPAGRSNAPRYMFLAEVRLLQGQYAAAIDLAQQAIGGDPPPRPGDPGLGRADFCRLILIAATALEGDGARARDLYRDYARIWPSHSAWRIAAYARHGVASLNGYKNFMAALIASGMPAFADEHRDDAIAPPAEPHHGGDFDPTPVSLPGARTADTAAMQTLVRGAPLVLDVGHGAGVIAGAVWNAHLGQDLDSADFAARIVRERSGGQRDQPVIVMGDGVFGYQSYNVALNLVTAGYRGVVWYRGGEEAWAAQHLPSVDRRP